MTFQAKQNEILKSMTFQVFHDPCEPCNHLRMLLQRQHFLLSYFKNLSVGSTGVELTTSRIAEPDAQPTESSVRGEPACNPNQTRDTYTAILPLSWLSILQLLYDVPIFDKRRLILILERFSIECRKPNT